MRLILDLLTSAPRAPVTGDLELAVEDAYDGVGCDEREGFLTSVRDGVVILVEAQVGRFSRGDGAN